MQMVIFWMFTVAQTEWKSIWSENACYLAAAENEKPTSTEIVAERVDQFERWYALSNIIFVSSPLPYVQNDVKWKGKKKKTVETLDNKHIETEPNNFETMNL